MRKITVPVPDALGDPGLYGPPPITEMQPYCVRAAKIMARWGMSPKTFKTLLTYEVLKPWVNAEGMVLYRLSDVIRLERDGWNQREGLPPSENFPLRGDRALVGKPKTKK